MVETAVTVPALLERHYGTDETRELVAWKSPDGWVSLTVGEFRTAVSEVAAGLVDAGLTAGDKVAIHSENRTEWLIADLAVLTIGAASVPIYTTQPADQIRYILEHSEAKLHFLSGQEMADASRGAAEELNIPVVAFDTIEGLASLDVLRERGRALLASDAGLLDRIAAKRRPDELASLIYTSGTTGTPKGVLLTHSNLAHTIGVSLKGVFTSRPPRSEGGKLLSFLPFAHIYEHTGAYVFLCSGYALYILPNVDTLVDDLAEVRPLHFTTVPRLLERVYGGIKSKAAQETGLKGRLMRWAVEKADNFEPGNAGFGYRLADRLVYSKMRDRLGGRLVGITSGGAALSADINRFFNAIGVPVGEGYGLTETSPVVAMYDFNDLRAGSIGKPVEGVEVKLGPDDELIVRGENVMQGYYKDEEATRAVLTGDGWFHTGDIAKIDEEGFLYIVDRKKELFKLSTGKYVAPAQVENRLISSPLIEQVTVVGDGRKFCSALIVADDAAVRAGFDHDPSDEEIYDAVKAEVDAANEGLPHWETVKRFKLVTEPMTIENGELTPTMKRKRRVIDQRRKTDIDAIYGDPEFG